MKKRIFTFLFFLQFFGAAFAQEKYSCVVDEYGLLSDSQISLLEEKASAVAHEYDCGIYIAVVNDMSACDVEYPDAFGIEAFAQYYYFGNDYGVGSSDDGIFLVMSMAERDYDIMAHGNFANYAFTDYGKEVLADSFLRDFGNNDWERGFSHFLDKTETLLLNAVQGTPVDDYSGSYSYEDSKSHNLPFSIAVGVIFGAIVALISCLTMKSSMKKVKLANNAVAFLCDDALKLSSKSDMHTHNTVKTILLQSSSGGSGGGTHINSSGSSHHSGKF